MLASSAVGAFIFSGRAEQRAIAASILRLPMVGGEYSAVLHEIRGVRWQSRFHRPADTTLGVMTKIKGLYHARSLDYHDVSAQHKASASSYATDT